MSIPNPFRPVRGTLGGLPSGYTRLQYIETHGGQFIRTDIVPDGNTAMEGRFQLTIMPSTDTFYFIGRGPALGSPKDRFNMYARTAGNYGFSVVDYYPTNMPCDTAVHTLRLDDSGVFSVDGVVAGQVESRIGNSNKIPIGIFCNEYTAADGSSIFEKGFFARCYDVKIYTGGKLFAHLVPCLGTRMVPCMFDLVQKETYYNATEYGATGEFLYA